MHNLDCRVESNRFRILGVDYAEEKSKSVWITIKINSDGEKEIIKIRKEK